MGQMSGATERFNQALARLNEVRAVKIEADLFIPELEERALLMYYLQQLTHGFQWCGPCAAPPTPDAFEGRRTATHQQLAGRAIVRALPA
jgi:hypothetical protein